MFYIGIGILRWYRNFKMIDKKGVLSIYITTSELEKTFRRSERLTVVPGTGKSQSATRVCRQWSLHCDSVE